MTDLNRLRVSLTKHNAHKVAQLLRDYPADEVFSHLDEVHAERAQARKNLSTLPGDVLPAAWANAKELGPEAIDALVLTAIIFSHHELIKAMANASLRQGFSGRIERGKQLGGKEYTNFARIIDQLEFATQLDNRGVTFNLRGIFEIPGFGQLANALLELKLLAAGWDKSSTVGEEAVRLGFEKVFGAEPDEFKDWLRAGAQPASAGSTMSTKDEEFFEEETEGSSPKDFEFKAGHQDRDVEPVSRSATPKSKANRLHNDIQNKLYTYLKGQVGAKHVGTEIDTGSGTSIDAATQFGGQTTFYEIKTSASVRSSIRQAIPQLLEYAFWPSERRAHELVIVSHLPITNAAKQYIEFLRNEFNLPLSYKQFDLKTNTLR